MHDSDVYDKQEQHEHENKKHDLCKNHLIVDYDQISNISSHQPLISETRYIFNIYLKNIIL